MSEEFSKKDGGRRERDERRVEAPSLLGRVPPHSADAEEYLLSCCFLDGKEVMAECLEKRVSAGAFFVPANRVIFEQLAELYNRGLAIDLQVLIEELKTKRLLEEVGGYAYLMQISQRIPTTAQVGYFIERVRELSLLRELIRVATRAVENCYEFEGGLEEFVDKVEQDIFGVTQNRVTDAAKAMVEPTKDAMVLIHKMINHKGELTGVSSGLRDLDKLTFGFQRQEMIVLAARPSMGKTSLALNFAEAAALPRSGKPGTGVLIFSLEMTPPQLALRMLCSRSRVNMTSLREGRATQGDLTELEQAANEFMKSPIFIDDSTKGLTVMELRAKARRVAAKQELGMILVDYLQLLSPTDPKVPREQQVAEMSRGLKALAKELNVPVIVLSQLNRLAEKEGRTPKLSDLRESGAIEQDADVVLMLAPGKGGQKDQDGREFSDKFQTVGDTAELIVAKNRNGAVGDLQLTFLRNITRFENFTN